jgi:hypothetical protein
MARFDVDDYESYLHLLAMYRNTNAIDAVNARTHYSELADLGESIDAARLAVIQRLRDRRSHS